MNFLIEKLKIEDQYIDYAQLDWLGEVSMEEYYAYEAREDILAAIRELRDDGFYD